MSFRSFILISLYLTTFLQQAYALDFIHLDQIPDSISSTIEAMPTINADGMTSDTLPISGTTKETTVRFADNDLEEQIIYGAVDSQWYDNKEKLMYLYGEAYVNYQDKELHADLIILDMENKIAEAKISEVKRNSKKPTFKDGEKVYEYTGLKYNFETEKGIVYEAITNEGEFRVHGERTKYVSGGDNLYGNSDVVYNSNSIITTCNHPGQPHFGFKAKKLKVVSEKVAVAGPANLQIAGIPTPLWIPFGFFPLTDATTSGLIFPEGYQFYNKELGFGLSGIGWYFPINDYVHTRLTADVYSRGTFAIYSNTDYKRKYKYSGSVSLSYNRYMREVLDRDRGLVKEPDPGFTIRVSHNQDAKAHPYRSLGGSINIVGNNNVRRLNNDAGSVLTSQYTSNLTFTHQMPRTPFSFRMGMSHNQNTNNNIMNFTLPDIALTMKTIYPLERKNTGGNKKKWYEKLALGYNSKLKVQTSTTDTTLFTQETIKNSKSGMAHDVNLSLSTRILKYFNLVPSATYQEVWMLNTIENSIIPSTPFADIGPTLQDTLDWQVDSLFQTVDSLQTEILSSGGAYRKYGAGVTLSTQIFGTKTFSRGPLRGIRHLVKPSITYGFAPDQTDQIDTLTYNDGRERVLPYSRFDDGPFGSPGFSDLRSQLSYNIGNVLEIKYFSRKDSTEKKFKIFDNVTASGNYNWAADSLKYSRTTIRSTSRIFGGMTQISSTWTLDPYLEANNKRINSTVWSDRKKLFRLESGNINVSTRFTFGKLRKLWNKKKEESRAEEADEGDDVTMHSDLFSDANMARNQPLNRDPQNPAFGDNHDHDHGPLGSEEEKKSKYKSIYDILDRLSLRHDFRCDFSSIDGANSSRVSTNSLYLTGSFDLTDNWSINIGNIGYDFVSKGPTYSTISFIRKLHCWDMNVTWSPVGRGNTYTFFIGVTSSTLSFLKYNYGQDGRDFFNGL